jgi:hypothetical protein
MELRHVIKCHYLIKNWANPVIHQDGIRLINDGVIKIKIIKNRIIKIMIIRNRLIRNDTTINNGLIETHIQEYLD